MQADADKSSPEPVAGAASPPVAARWRLPKLPLLIGVIGLGAAVTGGVWAKRRAEVREVAEARAIRTELAGLQADVARYRERFESLRWNAARYKADAQAAGAEPEKSWRRERAWRFDALLEEIDRDADRQRFEQAAREIDALCTEGRIAAARGRLRRLPPLKFPTPAEFATRWSQDYARPLAQFSRQNPGYYRLLKENEPDIAREDIVGLKRELAAAGIEKVTPQTMLGFELLGAVVPPDDPLLTDWTTLATAEDFLERPDAATLAAWREAQQAVRVQDWPTAVARMQAILRTTVRTRQPFRAAYGRAILHNRPDDTAAAYPLLQEAAVAGDRAAREWVSQEDYAKGRFGPALRWLEARVGDGETQAVTPLLTIYAMSEATVPRDRTRERGALERIVEGPDAPPLAAMLLARLYEDGLGGAKEPAKAFACYRRAAEKQFEPAWLEVARCQLRGHGTPMDLDGAREWAAKAYAAGERGRSVPTLTELMKRAPERTAEVLLELFERERTAAPAGFADTRVEATGLAELKMSLARYFDRKGKFARAAHFYAASGERDAAVARRYAELTTAHPCDTCGGSGKIETSTPCPTCGGKGTVQCNYCDGRGYILTPGAPPCATCGGTGGVVQDGHAVVCATCGGTGKGKSSVTKQECTHCVQGRIACPDCTNGQIKRTKECPTCHGTGSHALADA